MRSLLNLTLILGLALATSPALVGCADTQDDAEQEELGEGVEFVTSASEAEIDAAQATRISSSYQFDMLTRTGEKIMKASHYWMGVQDNYSRFPKARMCATNVSKVFRLGEISRYDQEGVRILMSDLGEAGGLTFKMSQNKAKFIEKLNTIYSGHLPAGTVIAGMSIHSSNPGDQHVGFIGHTDRDGVVWIYHNNWYRPENEGGARKAFMVSDENLRRGYPRQWMATPWLKLTRNAAGNVTDARSMLPALDDMDPFNPNFQVTLAIPREIAAEL